MVMECGKGEASRTVQGFDRNVPSSRRRLSNNYERDEEGRSDRWRPELEHNSARSSARRRRRIERETKRCSTR